MIKNTIIALTSLFFIFLNESIASEANFNNSFNLEKIFVKNYSIDTVYVAEPTKATSEHHYEQKIIDINNGITKVKIKGINLTENKTQVVFEWYDDSGVLLKSEEMGEMDIKCKVEKKDGYSPMPKQSYIGDSGVFPNLICSDNTTNKTSWELKKENNKAVLKLTSKIYPKSNKVKETIETKYFIDNSGKILNMAQKFYLFDKQILLLSSIKSTITYK